MKKELCVKKLYFILALKNTLTVKESYGNWDGSTNIRISKPNDVDEYYNVRNEYWQNRRNMKYRK